MSGVKVSSEENLRRVREKVMQLAREIETMSGEDIPPQTFFSEFLTRVVSAIGAKAGAVWMNDGGQLMLVAENGLEETGLKEIPGAMQTNQKLLIDVLQTGEAKTITQNQGIDLPTEHVMVLSALHKEKECVGVVQLFQRSDVPDKARSGYMQFLEQMCGYASRYLEGKRRNANMSDDMKSQWWTDFEQFTLRIQRSLEEQEVADASASDGRPLLDCDRLSVVTKKGSKVKVRAVSGQSTVNARANLVVAMKKLSRRVIDMGETLVYTGRMEGLAPQIEKPLAEFVQESGSRLIMMVPLFQSDELVRKQGEDEERKRKLKKPKAIGCLVVEQVGESEPAPELERRAELLADHIGAATWNARQHGRILGRSIFKAMGTVLEWFQGKKLAITLAVLAVIGGLIAAGTLIEMDYPVEAEGKLMPVNQYAVFAQYDGTIDDILVKPNQYDEFRVTDALPLLKMTNEDLNSEITTAEVEVRNHTERSKNNRLEHRQLGTDDSDQARQARSRLNIDHIQILTDKTIAETQLNKLLERRTQKLTVRAPADGLVADFKRMDILIDRPVKAGDHLFDVMDDDPEGEWHLELLVEEKRMGHILRTIRERGNVNIPGTFRMVSLPDSEAFDCHLTVISTRSTTDQELGTALELICVSDSDLPVQRIGTEVTVRLQCGKCSLAFYLFGDIVEFVQRQFWWF
ncbi:MAG: hypothetical protein ABJZ55_23290 [Fuerstiella sp.]